MTTAARRRSIAAPLGGALLLGGLLLALSRCFNPTLPDCSYRCGTQDPACPPEYECRQDRYCHLKGSTAACPYAMDLRAPADLRPAGDLADGGDAGDLNKGD